MPLDGARGEDTTLIIHFVAKRRGAPRQEKANAESFRRTKCVAPAPPPKVKNICCRFVTRPFAESAALMYYQRERLALTDGSSRGNDLQRIRAWRGDQRSGLNSGRSSAATQEACCDEQACEHNECQPDGSRRGHSGGTPAAEQWQHKKAT